MKSSESEIKPILGTAMAGGFYAGRIMEKGILYALIVAPKAEGEITTKWSESSSSVAGATSYNDGATNTAAMVEAGSALAKWASELRIGGNDDWYIPSQDELEVIYRNLKPTTYANTLYGRSGINASASPATYPYTATEPAQTLSEAFQAGGAEAFEPEWYWSSTQHASDSDFAWDQDFVNGNQGSSHKSYEGRARAVRRLPI